MSTSRKHGFVNQEANGRAVAANVGAEERKKLAPKLSPREQAMLQLFVSTRGTLETDTTLAFRLRALEKSEAAVHCGIAPKMVLETIVDLSKEDPGFMLIVNAIPSENMAWYFTRPEVREWAYSRVLFAEYDKISKMLTLGKHRVVTAADMFETVTGVLTGSLQTFYTTGDTALAKNIYRLLVSESNSAALNEFFLHTWAPGPVGECLVPAPFSAEVDKLVKLLSERDGNNQACAEFYRYFRSHNSSDSIRKYMCTLIAAIQKTPHLLHRSIISRLDYFVVQLLALPDLDWSSIEQPLLSAILTIAASRMPPMSRDIFTLATLEELVKYLHEKTPSFAGYMRYWAYLVLTVRYITSHRVVSDKVAEDMEQFSQQLEFIRDKVRSCPSLPTLCQLIAPNSGQKLTNEYIAEYILVASRRHGNGEEVKSEHEVKYSFVELRPEHGTPELLKQVQTNVAQLQALKAEIAAAARDSILDANREEKKAEVLVPSREVGKKLFDTINASCGNGGKLTRDITPLTKEIVRLAYIQSDSHALYLLQSLYLYFATTGVSRESWAPCGSQHWMRRVLALSLRPGTVVFAHYIETIKEQHLRLEYMLLHRKHTAHHTMFHAVRQYRAAANVSVPTNVPGRAAETEEKVTDELLQNMQPVRLVPFESSRHLAYEMRRVYDQTECVICAESRKIFSLHGDKRHGICVPCEQKLRAGANPMCPFCRQNL